MRRSRGFTLIEVAITLAVIGILAAMAFAAERAARRNANLSRATFDVVMRARQLPSLALRQQRDVLFVMVDAANANACSWGSPTQCAQYFILTAPAPAWTLNGFDPNNPGVNLDPTDGTVDSYMLPAGVGFHLAATGTPPQPFNGTGLFEASVPVPGMTASCNGRTCFAIHFTAGGDAYGELAAGGTTRTTGLGAFAAALTTDLLAQSRAADRKGLLFAFPSGIVRSFPVF